MRTSTIKSSLDTAISNLSTALDDYARARLARAPGECRLPGQFLDADGRQSSQHGLTAIALWIAISPRVQTRATRGLSEKCQQVISILYKKTKKMKADDEYCDLIKLGNDFEKLIVKRCLCLLALPSKESLYEEINFLLSLAFRDGTTAVGWPALLDSAPRSSPNHLITGYVLMAIADSLERFSLSSTTIPEPLAHLITRLIPVLSSFVSMSGQTDAYSMPIHRLFYLNCLYRLRRLGFDGDHMADIRKEFRGLLYKIYTLSAIDPAFVGTEIIAFYQAGDSDKYFRFNADVILLEAHFYAYNETLSAFQNARGKVIFDRVAKGYFGHSFSIDPNGQRVTIYSVFHALRVLDMIRGVKAPPFLSYIRGKWTSEWTFDRPALIRLFVATVALLAVTIVAYLTAPDHYAEGFAHIFLLASFSPLVEYSITKLTAGLLTRRMI